MLLCLDAESQVDSVGGSVAVLVGSVRFMQTGFTSSVLM